MMMVPWRRRPMTSVIEIAMNMVALAVGILMTMATSYGFLHFYSMLFQKELHRANKAEGGWFHVKMNCRRSKKSINKKNLINLMKRSLIIGLKYQKGEGKVEQEALQRDKHCQRPQDIRSCGEP